MTIDEAIERLQAIKEAHPDLDLELWCFDSFGDEVEAREFDVDRFSGRVNVL